MFISLRATRSLLLYESIVSYSKFVLRNRIIYFTVTRYIFQFLSNERNFSIEYNFREYETLFRNNINLGESTILQQLTYDNLIYEKLQSTETLVIYITFQFSTRHPILPGKTWRQSSYIEKTARKCEFA